MLLNLTSRARITQYGAAAVSCGCRYCLTGTTNITDIGDQGMYDDIHLPRFQNVFYQWSNHCMRIVLYFLTSVILILAVSSHAGAAEPKLTYKDGSEDFSALPEQAAVDGTKDFLLELRGEYPGYSMTIHTHFPQGLSPELDKTLLAKAREMHAESYSDALKGEDDMLEAVMTEVSAALLANKPLPPSVGKPGWANSYLMTVTYTAERPSKNVFSVTYMVYWFAGGAHPNRVYKTGTFDLKSGRELTLKDLFPGKKAVEPALADLAIKALAGRVKELTEEMMDINMNRISLTPDGLRIVYSPYEIASYAEGEFFVDIPLRDLEPLGVNASLWKE